MRDFAFGWTRKLRKTDDFSSVFRFRCACRGKALDVLLAPNSLDFARLGLIVPKKVLATAVARNRVKRLLREWFRLSQPTLSGMDVIVQIRARAPETVWKAEFFAALEDGRKRVGARTRPPTLTD